MTLQPQTVAELQEAVRAHNPITIRCNRTKSPSNGQTQNVLDLRALRGITDYSPDECVFTALAGTPLRDITTELAAHGQYLPFDPPLIDAGATIGGTVAAGLSGSGRYRYGGVRDFVIGARVVDGEGRLIRSGGKVVKNAAGFLLHHALVGSLGRFGAVTELTFKVFPAPEARSTLRLQCRSVTDALETVRAVENSRFDVEAIDFDSTGTIWIRVAGRMESLRKRIERLQSIVTWPSEILEGDDDERLWADAGEFRWIPLESSLVKVPIGEAGASAVKIASAPSGDLARFTCGGAVAWAAVSDPSTLAARLAEAGVRALIVRGPRAGTLIGAVEPNVFEERVRSVLDPHNRFSAASHPAR